MGGISKPDSKSRTSSRSETTNTSLNQNVQGNDGNVSLSTQTVQTTTGDVTINTLDGGAFSFASGVVEESAGAAVQLSEQVLKSFDEINSRSIDAVEGISQEAFSFVDKTTQEDQSRSFDNLVKWASLAGSVIAVSVYLGKK